MKTIWLTHLIDSMWPEPSTVFAPHLCSFSETSFCYKIKHFQVNWIKFKVMKGFAVAQR